MMAACSIIIIAWICIAAGRQCLAWLRLPDEATTLERNLLGYALGLGLLAYGVLVLGVVGLLYVPYAIAWIAALAIIGSKQHILLARSLRPMLSGVRSASRASWAIGAILVLFALVSAVGVYTPPTVALEWDSIAYHLADPKLYVLAHRIYYLPWESHSNFAFTTEMWYTVGLLFNSVPLAKWFHFSCGACVCLSAYAIASRHLSPKIGLWTAIILASTPLVFWEAGIAYADLATAYFVTATLCCVLAGLKSKSAAWLTVGAILMGLTLSTKATALSALVLFALGLLVYQWRVLRVDLPRVVGQVAVWCAVALAVGSPWYVRSAALTGNPVYPFYYNIFGGRYWNAANAKAYNQSNADFGAGRSPDKWLVSPWNLTMGLMPNHVISMDGRQFRGFNDRQVVLATISPLLLGALFFPAFRRRRAPLIVRGLALYALGYWVLWFLTAQHVRYLLPILPVLCLLAAWVMHEALSTRSISGRALIALAGCSIAFGFYVGASLLAAEAPAAFGITPKDQYLAASDPAHPAIAFINSHLPTSAKIVFYGNPLGFYCDRAYLWGDAGHSDYIPYGTFHSADDLRRYFASIGVTDILVNVNPRLNYFSMSPTDPGYTRWVYDLTAGSSAPIFSQDGVEVYALPPGANK